MKLDILGRVAAKLIDDRLANRRLLGRLAILDLAAGETPLASVVALIAALQVQHLARLGFEHQAGAT